MNFDNHHELLYGDLGNAIQAIGHNDDNRLRAAIIHLTCQHLESDGGYPFAYNDTTFPDFVIIADLVGDNETGISIYQKSNLIHWVDQSIKEIDSDCPDLCMALLDGMEHLIRVFA